MKIPQDTIHQILEASDIIDVISEFVSLKKAGVNYKGLCPFHGENTPSFVVSPVKKIFHCFGCHEGGDVVGFLKKHQNLGFVEAIQVLAERANIPIKWEGGAPEKSSPDGIYYKINTYAQWFFRSQFETSQKARVYISGRGFTEAIIEQFELGYAPDSFEGLLNFFKSKGIPLEKALELGLIKSSQKNKDGYYDFYRDRLMFPIRTVKGQVIGFGGRALTERQDQPKYVNSSESPIYHKSYELYGLPQAKKEILKTRQALVVEGYVDVLACHQLGLPFAVAPLGTSLTENQVKLLRRFADEIFLMFDGDAAGQEAAKKAVALCLSEGVHPHVVVLPEDKDPGDYLGEGGAKVLQDLVARSPRAMDWIFAKFVKTAGPTTTERAQTVKKLKWWIDKLPEPLEQLAFIQQIEEFFGLSLPRPKKVIEKTGQFASQEPLDSSPLSLEEWALGFFLRQESWRTEDNLSQIRQYFCDIHLKDLVDFVQNFYKKHETFKDEVTIRDLPEDLHQIYTKLMTADFGGGDFKIEDVLARLKKHWQKTRQQQMTAELLMAQTQKDVGLQKRLLKEKQDLLNRK